MNARPILSGATAGPTWPISSGSETFFLGVMYPKQNLNESLIVAFAARPHATPARVLARLRMRAQGFSVVPGTHTSAFHLNLHERTAKGALRHVVLELDGATSDSISRHGLTAEDR